MDKEPTTKGFTLQQLAALLIAVTTISGSGSFVAGKFAGSDTTKLEAQITDLQKQSSEVRVTLENRLTSLEVQVKELKEQVQRTQNSYGRK